MVINQREVKSLAAIYAEIVIILYKIYFVVQYYDFNHDCSILQGHTAGIVVWSTVH